MMDFINNITLLQVPSTLIIQMPRFGKQYKSFEQVQLSPHLDITDLIEGCKYYSILN